MGTVYVQKKLFGMLKYWKSVSRGSFGGRYNIDDWDYDIVKCAKHAVKKYENRIASKIRHRKLTKESFEKFGKWDGKIN